MKFSEFVNKNKNVVASSTSHRISAAIPITEERDAFFNGELFKKYDNVTSDGKTYRILEQCSNYYQVVDETGTISRKFAKQLTKAPPSAVSMTESVLHGYQIRTEEARRYYALNFFVEAYDNDDVGMLKQLKEMDSKVDDYKPKDKLTVAKIIADVVGIPHDAISDPNNLVNAAIRKAKKDPVLMKNKAILQNMLQIAKEVGIKYSDSTFEVKESTDWSPGAKETIKKDKVQSLRNLIASYQSKKNFKKVAELQKELDGLLKESEELEEGGKFGAAALAGAIALGGALGYGNTKGNAMMQTTPQTAYKAGKDLRKKIDAPDVKKTEKSVKESEELDEISASLAGRYYEKATKEQIAKKGLRGAIKDTTSKRAKGKEKALDRILPKTQFESTEIDEHIVKTDTGYRLVSKSTGKNLGDFDSKEAAEKHEREVQFFKTKNESILKPSDQAKTTLKHIKDPSLQDKYAAYDIKPGVKGYRDRIDMLRDAKAKGKLKEEVEEISEEDAQKHMQNVMDRIPPHKRDAARKLYNDARKKGQMHAAALNTVVQVHLKEELEQIEELSKTTLSSYSTAARADAVKKGNQGAKAKKPEVAYSKFKKAATRLASAAKADKKVFAKDWKERTGQNEAVESPSAVTYKDLKAKIDNKKNDSPTSVVQKPEPADDHKLPASHHAMATNNTTRKMIVKKLSDI